MRKAVKFKQRPFHLAWSYIMLPYPEILTQKTPDN